VLKKLVLTEPDSDGRSAGARLTRGVSPQIAGIGALMRQFDLEADVDCFWYGDHGATPPVIPDDIRAAFAQIGATIETDFDTD
jgi:hypothetical protein